MIGRTIDSKYRLVRLLGEGGCALCTRRSTRRRTGASRPVLGVDTASLDTASPPAGSGVPLGNTTASLDMTAPWRMIAP
ncbi:hypothetical protein WME94_30675 [Sorangium sp. So ce429]